jgi:hypothetical protein
LAKAAATALARFAVRVACAAAVACVKLWLLDSVSVTTVCELVLDRNDRRKVVCHAS